MPNTTATAPLDTTHVTRLPSGDFAPSPRLAYAMVHVSLVLWDRFYDPVLWDRFYDPETGAWQEIAVGREHCGPLPVRIPAGKRLNECVGYSPASGDTIVTAFACTREDYSAALAKEAEENQDWDEF